MENGEKFGNASNVDMCLNELEYETGKSSGAETCCGSAADEL